MFAKLVKHEWRSGRGALGLICLICVTAAVLGGLSIRYLVWGSSQTQSMQLFQSMRLFNVLSVLALVASGIAIAVCGMGELIFLIWRFYKSRYTDEGYLTFTLPVTTHQILLSSMVNSVVSMLIVTVAVVVSVVVMLLVGFSGVEGFWTALAEAIPQLFSELARCIGREELGYAALAALNVLVGIFCGSIMLMLSVTVGSVIAKKHKVLAAVGTYYAIQVAMSIAEALTMTGVLMLDGVGYAYNVFSANLLLMLAVTVGGYFLMHYLADKKLNLT